MVLVGFLPRKSLRLLEGLFRELLGGPYSELSRAYFEKLPFQQAASDGARSLCVRHTSRCNCYRKQLTPRLKFFVLFYRSRDPRVDRYPGMKV